MEEVTQLASEVPRGLDTRQWVEVALEDLLLQDATFQYRFQTSTAGIKASLRDEGQREPIDLTGRKPYRIVDGFRRAAAAKELGWTSIKAFVHHGLSEEQAFRLAFTKNVVRQNLSPIEKAAAMRKARLRGMKQSALAELFGISDKQVRRYLELLDFPEPIQRLLDGRGLSMAHARLLAEFEVHDPAAWKKRIDAGKLDVRTLRQMLRREHGQVARGRKRLVLKKEKDGIRLYPLRIRKDAPKEERERVVKLLQEAIEFLK